MRRAACILAVLVAVSVVSQVVPRAVAGVEGRYRLELMDGKFVEGDVKELPDGTYEVKTKFGAIVTLKKSQVRAMRPLEDSAAPKPAEAEAPGRGTTAIRRPIADAAIEEVLSGVVATPDEARTGVGRSDMLAPLPLDEPGLEDMLKQAAGDRDKNVLLKDHFVMVYTSTEQSARELASRLEAVYRWNVKFLEMMKLPARRPAHKLEIYYFGTWEEFDRYSRNSGFELPTGVLGYYAHDNNRAHFFDLMTWPVVAPLLEQLKQPNVPWKDKQRITNRIKRIVEYQNVGTVQHETGHMIHFNIGLFPLNVSSREAGAPTWLVEGTTMQFEVPPSTAGAGIGVLNHSRLFEVRQLFGWHPLTPERWKLFLIDNAQWYNSDWGVAASYPLGWAIVYYMWTEHRDGYAKYLQKVFGREEVLDRTQRERELQDCFGTLDDKWFKKFYEFLDSLELRPSLCGPEEEEAAKVQNIAFHRTRLGKNKDSGTKEGGESGGGGGGGGRGKPR